MRDVFDYVDAHRQRSLEQLLTLLRQPSISTQNVGVREMAVMLADSMRGLGIDVTIFETPGHPIVYGELPSAGARRTLLVYGHYDVQPPDPLELWTTPPFEPTIRDGRLYGRGTGDNKGQLFTHLKAAEAFLQTRGKAPVNLKFLFEGEEEMSSPNLGPFMEAHRGLLAADGALIFDGPGHESGRPMITCGLKGLCYVEITARGANRDLHSMRAAAVPSPAWRLVQALGTIKDAEGKVLIPGFYDAVRAPTTAELEALKTIPNDALAVRRHLQIDELLGGDEEYYYRMAFSPTCNIAGLTSGYQGKGKKTVLPCRASAKIDFRLVPDQRPEEILELLKAHLKKNGYGDLEVEAHGDLTPSRTPVDNPFVQRVVRGVERAAGEAPIVSPSMGGSGPDYLFTGVLGLPSVWLPLSPHDSNNHAPNESILLEGFYQSIKISAAIMEEVEKLS